MPSAAVSGSTPAATSSASAPSALATLNSPGSRTSSGDVDAVAARRPRSTDPPGTATTPPATPVRVGVADGVRRHRQALGAAGSTIARAPLVVDAHDRAVAARRGEQLRLRVEVVVHVAVEVEVVGAQVGEAGDVEAHAVDATEAQRVAGHLHRHRGDAALAHHREQRVHVGGLRGRAHGRHDVVADPRADGADDAR